MSLVPKLRFPECNDEWQVKKFDKLIDSISSGKSSTVSDGSEYPIFGSTGKIGESSNFDYSGDKILIARVGANAGMVYRVNGKYKVSDNTLMVNLNNLTDTTFVKNLLLNLNLNKLVFGSGQPLVTGGMLKNTRVTLPLLPEQRKIAEFLTFVDTKIESIDKKVVRLMEYKKGVMQKIFTQQIRFKDEDRGDYPDWKTKKAGDIFKNISNRDHDGDLPILSVTQDGGVVLRDSLERKIDSSDAGIKNYKIIEPGDFVISLRSFQGGLELSQIKGISSPAYTVIRATLGVLPAMYKHYFKRELFISQLNETVIGIRDGKQISYGPFSNLSLPVPCIEEQQKIADFLSILDNKIRLEESKLLIAKKFKKTLLKLMFV